MCCNVDDCGRLADSTFLIDDRDDPCPAFWGRLRLWQVKRGSWLSRTDVVGVLQSRGNRRLLNFFLNEIDNQRRWLRLR